MRTLIVGLGNPILGDDGVGWVVAKRVQETLNSRGVDDSQTEVDCLSLGGLGLMERLVGYDQAILIDAIEMGLNPTGSIYQFDLDQLPGPTAGHSGSVHDTSLRSAIDMGRAIGLQLPCNITVIGVEAHTEYEFSDSLTPQVAAAVPLAAEAVVNVMKFQNRT